MREVEREALRALQDDISPLDDDVHVLPEVDVVDLLLSLLRPDDQLTDVHVDRVDLYLSPRDVEQRGAEIRRVVEDVALIAAVERQAVDR